MKTTSLFLLSWTAAAASSVFGRIQAISSVATAAKTPIETVFEGSLVTFSLGNDRYVTRTVGSAGESPIGVRITKLPPISMGDLIDSHKVPVDLETNFNFLETDNLTFVPKPHVFNSFDNLPKNSTFMNTKDCDGEVLFRGQRFCGISFRYKAFLDDEESEEQEAFFIVEAVNDGDSTFRIHNEFSPTIQVNGLSTDSSGRVFASIFDTEITSDAGENLFRMNLRITTSEGVIFQVKRPESDSRLEVVDGNFSILRKRDCATEFCTSALLSGEPKVLQTGINLLDIRIEEGVDFPAIRLVLADEGKDMDKEGIANTVSFEVLYKEPTTRDDVDAVAAMSVWGMLGMLCMLLFIFFLTTHVRLIESEIVDNRPVNHNAAPSTVSSESPGEEVVSVDSESAVDWNKAVSHHSASIHYYNPRTGESSKTPPKPHPPTTETSKSPPKPHPPTAETSKRPPKPHPPTTGTPKTQVKPAEDRVSIFDLDI